MASKKAVVTGVQINHPECELLLRQPGGAVHTEVSNQTLECEHLAKMRAPKDTGKGAESINSEVRVKGKYVVGTIGTPIRYMKYQEIGTGPIYPKKAQALRFRPKGAPFFVFAKKTKGVPAQHYLLDSLKQVTPWPVREHE